jgi:hypothetical protein
MAAAADLTNATDESKQTSITETSLGDAKPQEAIGAPKVEGEAASTTDGQNAATVTEAEDKKAEIDDEDVEYPHGAKLWVILAALCLAVFLVALDQTIIATAIPKITDHFNSIQDIGWYGSSYLLTATALQPTFGRIYTIFSVSILFDPAIQDANIHARSNTLFSLPL